jgi:hypothetical protein
MSCRSKIPRSPTLVTRQRSPRHAAERPRVPRLHAEDIADDSALGCAVDRLIIADDNYTKLTAVILDHQGRLQRLCEPDAWVEYLHVEAAVNERVNMMLVLIARRAFNEGRRHQQRR